MKATLMAATCAMLLWAGPALATPTAQQKCDYARVTAWKVYQSCWETAVAKDAKHVSFDDNAAFAKCRHAYFKEWTAFQSKASLTGSTCIGSRYTDNGTTVTDHMSGLVWEKKTGTIGGSADFAHPENVNNTYTLSTGVPYAENGTAFTSFLSTVNSGGGFAGANGWRLPTSAELQTIVLDFACTGTFLGATCSCSAEPCIDPVFESGFNTEPDGTWSATTEVSFPSSAWVVDFAAGDIVPVTKDHSLPVRAVRGSL